MTHPTPFDIDSLTIGQAREIARQFGFARDRPPVCDTRQEASGIERPVLVTTEHRGVFFGYATDVSGDTIDLKRARNCIYWPAETKGFLGLASDGPGKGSRVGPPADIQLRKITCVADVSETAVKAWEASPWSK